MGEMNQTPDLASLPPAVAQPVPPSLLRRIFFNEVELRAGWRFLIFLIVLIAVSFAANFVVRHIHKATKISKNQPLDLRASPVIFEDGLSLLMIVGVTAIMARFEKRKLRHYGLPLRTAFRGNFWLGCLWGFGAISLLLLALRADHNFYFGTPELSGLAVYRFGLLWGFAFVLVGLFEEFLLRGYAQFTFTTGMGFWPAALLLSVLFAGLHWSNPGETIPGLLEIVLIALFFCFTLWKTGTLWFAVGFHAAWDWGQSFFYGTPDSGLPAQGHLLHSSFAGSPWLTGGSAGPEGSLLLAPLFLLLLVLFNLSFKKQAPYPDPEAIKSPQAVSVSQAPSPIFSAPLEGNS